MMDPAAARGVLEEVLPDHAGDMQSILLTHSSWNLTSKIKGFFSDAFRADLGGANALAVLHRFCRSLPANASFNHAEYLERSCCGRLHSVVSGRSNGLAHAVEGRYPFSIIVSWSCFKLSPR